MKHIYTQQEIEEFLKFDEEASKEDGSSSLRKLLSVQDKISIFKDIDPQELKSIVYDLKFIKYNFKDYIIEEGMTSEEIFFVIEGSCHVFSNRKKVGALNSGEIFGEAGAIFQTKRNATIVCGTKDATLLSFKIDSNNLEFCSVGLAILYKNLAREINAKLDGLNIRTTRDN